MLGLDDLEILRLVQHFLGFPWWRLTRVTSLRNLGKVVLTLEVRLLDLVLLQFTRESALELL